MNMNDNKLSLLAEHYQDTFNFQKENLLRRDKLFLFIILILTIMLFIIYTPKDAHILISQYIQNKLSFKSEINFLFIQGIIWFVLLALVIKYFQILTTIERQYNYIHKTEELLSEEYGNKIFNREGVSYLSNYPKFLNWASYLYTILFPILIFTISTVKIYYEFKMFGFEEFIIWINLLLYIFMLVSIILYQYELYKNYKKLSKTV